MKRGKQESNNIKANAYANTNFKNLTHGHYVSKWMKQHCHSHSYQKICFLKYKLKVFANIMYFMPKFI
jgi:hypothetical protein